MPSQYPSDRAPVLVVKTDQVRPPPTHTHTQSSTAPSTYTHTQGKLDYLTYPHRLMIADIVPNIINAVMLLEITSFKDTCQDVTVHAKDSTGDFLTS